MFLIAGLGNPEKDYKGTRHNVGFEVINKLSYDYNIQINKAKFRAHCGEGFIFSQKVMLLKPQTFMNLSGESIRDAMAFYKLTIENLIVIYDDVDLDISEIRIRETGSAGGHNGMKNILYQLETDKFLRVRVGIGKKPSHYILADYVLSKFNKNEEEPMIQGITKGADAVSMILKQGASAAMNLYNQKKIKKEED